MSGFQKKTIRKICRNRIDALLASIPDVEDEVDGSSKRDNRPLKDDIRRDILITGGAITSMLLGERVNDFDVYFKTYDTALEVARYYVELFNRNRKVPEAGVKYTPEVVEETRKNIKGEEERRIIIMMRSAGVAGEEQSEYGYFESLPESEQETFLDSAQASMFGDQGTATVIEDGDSEEPSLGEVEEQWQDIKKKKGQYRPVFLTDNAISLSDKMQLITRFYGTPEEIHRNYDFVHCTGVYDYRTDSLTLSPEMMEAVLTKRLIYVGSLYPIASALRTRKFIERGWRISAGQMLKIMVQCARVNFRDVGELKEQLMGVDVAYMHQLITELSKVEPNTRVDETYLANLMDRVFEE